MQIKAITKKDASLLCAKNIQSTTQSAQKFMRTYHILGICIADGVQKRDMTISKLVQSETGKAKDCFKLGVQAKITSEPLNQAMNLQMKSEHLRTDICTSPLSNFIYDSIYTHNKWAKCWLPIVIDCLLYALNGLIYLNFFGLRLRISQYIWALMVSYIIKSCVCIICSKYN